MSLHDIRYKHWEGRHLGVWYRRWVIGSQGLRACLRNRWTQYLVLVCWMACLFQIGLLFVLGQLLVEDSVVHQFVGTLNAQVRTFVEGLVHWITDRPEISVRTAYNVVFFMAAYPLRFFSFIAIALVIPHLISRDIASRALIIYSSKALSRFDYLFGKFVTVFGLLMLTWVGPSMTAWFVGNLLASDWSFFWHSRTALANALSYAGMSAVVLGGVALGLSALSRNERTAVASWVMFWLIGNALGRLGETSKPWLRHFSVSFNLDQIALAVFDLAGELKLAQDNIPVLGMLFSRIDLKHFGWFKEPEIPGTLVAIGIMLSAVGLVLWRKVRPE